MALLVASVFLVGLGSRPPKASLASINAIDYAKGNVEVRCSLKN